MDNNYFGTSVTGNEICKVKCYITGIYKLTFMKHLYMELDEIMDIRMLFY